MRNEEEAREQKAFVQYLKIKGIMFSALRQETPMGHFEGRCWKPHFQSIKNNKEMGLEKGVPDLMLIVPRRGRNFLVFIELKAKKGKLSKEQESWKEAINEIDGNVCASVFYSADEAIKFIESFK